MKKDTVSGSLEILLSILKETGKIKSSEEWQRLRKFILENYPSMAILLNFVEFVDKNTGKNDFSELSEMFRRRVEEEQKNLVEKGVKLLERYIRVLTYSRSSQVMSILKALRKKGLEFEVFISEGRPSFEGIKTAYELASEGIKVTLFTDIALVNEVKNCEIVLTGADAVTDDYFINKVGTRIILEEAKKFSIPAYLAATPGKVLSPEMFRYFKLREGSPSEIAEPSPLLTVKNPYFEEIPLSLVKPILALK